MRLRALLVGSLLCSGAWAAVSDAEFKQLARSASEGIADARARLEVLAQDDSRAAHYLGTLYATGRGVTQSDAQAVEWFKRAATAGRAESAHAAALIYQRSAGEVRDLAAAREWYRAAAARGYG